MTKNAGIKNLGKLDLQRIGEKASFTENKKPVEKGDVKRKQFPIYPHPELLEILKSARARGKLSVSISPYIIMAIKEKLVRDGFEKELKESGLL